MFSPPTPLDLAIRATDFAITAFVRAHSERQRTRQLIARLDVLRAQFTARADHLIEQIDRHELAIHILLDLLDHTHDLDVRRQILLAAVAHKQLTSSVNATHMLRLLA
jgi:hypothetical protein